MQADQIRCEGMIKSFGGLKNAMRMGKEKAQFKRCENATETVVIQGSDEMGLCDTCLGVFKARNPKGFNFVTLANYSRVY